MMDENVSREEEIQKEKTPTTTDEAERSLRRRVNDDFLPMTSVPFRCCCSSRAISRGVKP